MCASISVCDHPAARNAAMADDECYSHELLHSLQEPSRRHQEQDASIKLMSGGAAGDAVSSDSSDASTSVIFFSFSFF